MKLVPHFAKVLLTLGACLSMSLACVSTPKDTAIPQDKPAAHLTFDKQNLIVDAYWLSRPAVETEQFLRLETRDAKTGKLVPSPLPISVSVWMKTHSYGLVEPSVEPFKDDKGEVVTGTYKVSGIYFLASGQWQVRVYLNDKNDPKAMQSFIADLGAEKLNPIDDPKSPMYHMMNKSGGGMDHSQHMKMMQEAQKAEAERAKSEGKSKSEGDAKP